eukprot:9485332-Pyramimonas_sp.AAC.1
MELVMGVRGLSMSFEWYQSEKEEDYNKEKKRKVLRRLSNKKSPVLGFGAKACTPRQTHISDAITFS